MGWFPEDPDTSSLVQIVAFIIMLVTIGLIVGFLFGWWLI